MTSVGQVRFTSSVGSGECAFTLAGTLAASAEATLTATPDPSRNPKIGDITGIIFGRCNEGFFVALTFPWALYEYGLEGTRARLYIQKAKFLEERATFVRCLLEARWLLTYTEEAESRVRIAGIEQVVRRPLEGGICGESPGIIGEFRLAPQQRLTLI